MEWLPIKGYDGCYFVNDQGDVLSLKEYPHKLLSPQVSRTGYKCVRLSHKGSYKTLNIHRIVAETFLPPGEVTFLPPGEVPSHLHPVVDHINGDKNDNRVENLRWISHKHNLHRSKKYQQYMWGQQ